MVKVEIQDVSFSYDGGPEVISGVSLAIPEGTSMVILGANGAGKTTLVKLFNGLLLPIKGSVLVDGRDTKKSSVSDISREVGVIFQNPEKQFFSETVEEELAFGPKNMGFSQQDTNEKILRVAEQFGLTQYLKKNPFDLSGGEKRRLSIASVLVWEPQMIVIDEPTIGLDYQYRKYLISTLRNFVNKKRTVVIVTHDVDFAIHASRVAVLMSQGKILWNGPMFSLLRSPDTFAKANLVQTFLASLVGDLLSQEEAPNEELLERFTKHVREAV